MATSEAINIVLIIATRKYTISFYSRVHDMSPFIQSYILLELILGT